MRIRYLLLSALLILFVMEGRGSIEKAEKDFDDFRKMVSAGKPDANAYKLLEDSYGAFAEALREAPAGSETFMRAKSGLKEIFPYLRQGAYYFAEKDDQENVLRFAADYVDLSLLPGMGDEQLQATPGYSVLANLAATNIYNRGDYKNAIRYFQAYLTTGDPRNSEMAFEGLARSFYELRNYENATYIASLGIESFPSNWNMLVVGIEACGHTGNDEKMEKMLDLALKINPAHATLLEYKGKLLERTGRYPEAAEIFHGLYGQSESSLDYACHLAFDLYNSGLGLLEKDPTNPEGRNYLEQAIPIFETIFSNVPYAANIGRALGVCYALTDNEVGMAGINEKLTALRVDQVRPHEIPGPETQYLPSVNVTPSQSVATTFHSDVDVDIPESGQVRPNTYVVVIANEDYKYFADVDYAKRDGEVFAEYCRKTLGVPQENVRERYDATLAEMREPLRYLNEKTAMNPGELDIIVYYAGHGIPDVSRGKAHLLPVDASGTDFESCVDLDDMCSKLSEMPAKSVTVFLDACFSGATRGNEMLFRERFVEYEVEDVVTKGNLVVFAATSGNQTAMGYDEKRHGFFTYFLLNNLKDSKGRITLGELGRNLSKEVDNMALDKKNKHQTPTVKADSSLGNAWENRNL